MRTINGVIKRKLTHQLTRSAQTPGRTDRIDWARKLTLADHTLAELAGPGVGGYVHRRVENDGHIQGLGVGRKQVDIADHAKVELGGRTEVGIAGHTKAEVAGHKAHGDWGGGLRYWEQILLSDNLDLHPEAQPRPPRQRTAFKEQHLRNAPNSQVDQKVCGPEMSGQGACYRGR